MYHEAEYEDDNEGITPCCHECEGSLQFGDEVIQVRLRQTSMSSDGQGLEFSDATDTEGSLYYDSLYFHFECYESIITEAREQVEEVPDPIDALANTVDKADRFWFLKCALCGDKISAGEDVVVGYFGEFDLEEQPDGTELALFCNMGKRSQILCLGCTALIDEEVCLLWSDISFLCECSACTRRRCWRMPSCSCACHREKAATRPSTDFDEEET